MRRLGRRGYTAVELLMSVAVFAVGISGIIAMEKVTVVSNQHAKNLTIATPLAQSWIAQLTTDAALWNNPSPVTRNNASDIAQTAWLSQQQGAWFQPTYNVTRQFGPAFDALGNVTQDPALTQFCTHLRLTQLVNAKAGSGLLRAVVRVFGLRVGQPSLETGGPCSGTNVPQVGTGIANYHFVYETTAISQQTIQ